eukprot:10622083-Ditylum_brightwellii.AAC.1
MLPVGMLISSNLRRLNVVPIVRLNGILPRNVYAVQIMFINRAQIEEAKYKAATIAFFKLLDEDDEVADDDKRHQHYLIISCMKPAPGKDAEHDDDEDYDGINNKSDGYAQPA